MCSPSRVMVTYTNERNNSRVKREPQTNKQIIFAQYYILFFFITDVTPFFQRKTLKTIHYDTYKNEMQALT